MEKRNNCCRNGYRHRYRLTVAAGLIAIGLAACDSGTEPEEQASDAVAEAAANAETSQNGTPAPATASPAATVAQATGTGDDDTGGNGDDDGIFWNEIVYGSPDAPVTIIEYASMTCPHCAAFHATAFQELKRDYIDTGKVKLYFREFPLDQRALLASMLARCAGEEKAPRFIDALFKQQRSWALAPDPQAGLAQVARLGGMGQAKFEACMNNQELARLVAESRKEGSENYNISATPTIIVNGESRREFLNYDELDKYLQGIL